MSDEDAYRRILASLSDAMLDDSHWPATSALIDEACGLTSNALMIGEGPKDDIRVLTPGFYRRGQRHEEQERKYLRIYHPIDERVPRVRRLPDSRLVHVKPVAVPQPDYGAQHTAALILIVEPRSRHRIDPNLVAGTLGLTPMESQVAVWLAEGKSVRDMAEATGRTEGSIYWHLKQIYQKQPVSRQVDLVRLVLSITEFG